MRAARIAALMVLRGLARNPVHHLSKFGELAEWLKAHPC